jgi:hypothetical protein
MAQVQAELQKDELEDAKRGDVQMHETSPHSFLHVGLELEEQQCIFNVYQLLNSHISY